MQYKDYYRILGVPRDASADDIKKAFRKLARKYHPDVSKEGDAEARMKEINEAHTVLSDPERRAAYDQLGRGWKPGQEFHAPPGWEEQFESSSRGFAPGEEGEFSDFFAELFGHLGGLHGAGPRAARPRGRGRGMDRQARVELDVEDAFGGVSRQISLGVPVVDASGRLRHETRTLHVKIPRGVRAGQVIRLAGQGEGARGGAPAGDLLLEVAFRPHPRYQVDGRDLRLALPVAPWEAALGALVPVQLPGGEVRVRVPAGAQSGGQLRLRGKGIPGDPPGDALLDLRIVVPPADTPRARELYEAMAKELAFDPRQADRA
jgi:curved DNA-binding protein